MNKFILTSDYQPTGDQPEAIRQLTDGLQRGDRSQVLLGVTGSGKTFTMANVIAKAGKPTLILSHNKTLAAQLYEEMRGFFPENAVEYYVSYYDYYQPEAYLPSSDTYIEKDLAINEEIDRLRLSAVSALLSGRKDVVVVSSVSCIYGMGSPVALHENVIELRRGQTLDRNALLRKLVSALYVRNDLELKRGCFRVKGDTVDVAMAYSEVVLRITFWDDEIDAIEELDSVTMTRMAAFDEYKLYPANLFMTTQEQTNKAIHDIQDDLVKQVAFFEELGDPVKAARIKERVEYDMEMIKELGHCSGIENYSRYFDGRRAGERPYCLLDFFPKDFLLIVDESHVSVPQIGAMYGGDRARKTNLVEYAFRLPAAFDNRPLTFDEFQQMVHQVIYVSATPADFELQEAEGVVVEQLIRPTGLLDPEIEVRPSEHQIDDLMEEIRIRTERKERTLVTTLTKRMAEELTEFLMNHDVQTAYIHSDVSTLDRVKILSDLRSGVYDVLVGVNLLREGLDLPEVSLVAILDARHHHPLHATDHRRDQPPAHQAAKIQRRPRHHAHADHQGALHHPAHPRPPSGHQGAAILRHYCSRGFAIPVPRQSCRSYCGAHDTSADREAYRRDHPPHERGSQEDGFPPGCPVSRRNHPSAKRDRVVRTQKKDVSAVKDVGKHHAENEGLVDFQLVQLLMHSLDGFALSLRNRLYRVIFVLADCATCAF